MTKSPPLRLSKDQTAHLSDDGRAERTFAEMFGDDFAINRVLGFVTGHSPDGESFGVTFHRADGGVINLSMKIDLLPEFGACLAATWQHCADQAALKSAPKGNA